MKFTVAVDGPAAAGKGTICRAIAAHFGFAHLDTGALYRAVGMKAHDDAISPIEAARALSDADLQRTDLRSMEAGKRASQVAVIPEVRAALLDFQRDFARKDGGAVLDGRDIGTVICPTAEIKLYVTASAEVRARRRWLEIGGENGPRSYENVLAEVIERDELDRNRPNAPLRPAEDAIEIDTSALSIEAAIAQAQDLITAKIASR